MSQNPIPFTSPFSNTTYPVTVRTSTYRETDDIALILDTVHPESGLVEPFAVASVCLPDMPCMPGHCYLKTYSENEGIPAFLIENGIVEAAKPFWYVDPKFMYVKVLV